MDIIPLPSKTCPFKDGDPVALLGGSVIMTVIATHKPPTPSEPWAVSVAWHDDVGCEHEAAYPVTALQGISACEEPPVEPPRRPRRPRKPKEVAFTPSWDKRGKRK